MMVVAKKIVEMVDNEFVSRRTMAVEKQSYGDSGSKNTWTGEDCTSEEGNMIV